MAYKKRRKSKREETLGPIARRFAEYLDCGLHYFDECLSNFEAKHVRHEEHGDGLIFSQLKADDYGVEQSVNHTVVAFESGIMWPSGATICFNNEQPPEKVALAFVSALVREIPVVEPICESCREG